MPIPPLQEDGFLPPGLFLADMDEIDARFGRSTPQRQHLFERLEMFIELGRHCGALRILVNGSFVTAKPEPSDVDVVIWLGERYLELLDEADESALRLKKMFDTRKPKEALLAIDAQDWDGWVWFFSGIKEIPHKQKGIVELEWS